MSSNLFQGKKNTVAVHEVQSANRSRMLSEKSGGGSITRQKKQAAPVSSH